MQLKTNENNSVQHNSLFPSSLQANYVDKHIRRSKGRKNNWVLFEGDGGLNIKTKTGTASKHLEKSIPNSQTPINSSHKNLSREGQRLARITIKKTGAIFSYIHFHSSWSSFNVYSNYLETCPNYTDLLVKIMIV